MIVSLDMHEMNQIKWIDKENMLVKLKRLNGSGELRDHGGVCDWDTTCVKA